MRIRCLNCNRERSARVDSRECLCGWMGWDFVRESVVVPHELAHLDDDVAVLAVADALNDGPVILRRTLEGSVRLVLAMDILEPPQRFVLLGLLDALEPFEREEVSA